jgi:glycosyltransferase involved in cell wall biosynthesis
MKRILFVGMVDAIHAVRWISQITDQECEVFFFPVERARLHPEFRNLTIFTPNIFSVKYPANNRVRLLPWVNLLFLLEAKIPKFLGIPAPGLVEKALQWVVQTWKPDLVHSLEFQKAGYLTLAVKQKMGARFPRWIATNWGSDIALFGKFPEHREKIQSILAECDYYSAECQRDVDLAKELGFNKKILPVLPNAGGYDLEKIGAYRQPGAVSSRRVVLLKGYQGWAGRGLAGLRALTLCADALKGFRVLIFAASPDVVLAARVFTIETGIPTEIIPYGSHAEMLRLHGQARIYIGLSIVDGISTSLLEALVMGAFPIQSCTACADEWITDGENGFIIPPEDPHVIAQAIRTALTNDALVDGAAEKNSMLAQKRLERKAIKTKVVEMYKEILK